MDFQLSYETSEFIEELSRLTSSNPIPYRKSKGNRKQRSNTNKISSVSRNAARERTRVKSLRIAFQNLQRSLPYVPPNTKLSKLDVLILATTYISHLMRLLNQDQDEQGTTDYQFTPCSSSNTTVKSRMWESSYLHPVKKWPMRSRLYAGVQDQDRMSLSIGMYHDIYTDNIGLNKQRWRFSI